MNASGKIALVTGGSRGLGKEMVLQLASKGISVAFTYPTNATEAEKVKQEAIAKGVQAWVYQLNVANSASFGSFVENLMADLKARTGSAKINYLVNNAGIGHYSAIADTTEEALDQMYAIHVKAPFLLSQKLLPYIKEGGAIINISSGLSRFSYAGYAAYATMKGGMDTLTRYMAQEFGAKKIRVNILAPGAIETDFGGGAVRDNKELNKMIAGQTALGRVGLPDDIGSVIAFLCSDESKWINAQRIEVSGGIHM
jgi:NAD(P)-dependent dehydrogenase (short-subunit alcohol dehydrogenase family)